MAMLVLEDFDVVSDKAVDPFEDPRRLEEFETGYQAGWADALAANDSRADLALTQISGQISDIVLTLDDARSHVLAALAPLIHDLTALLLPRIAQSGLPHLVAEAVIPIAAQAAEFPVNLTLHPSQRLRIEAVMPQTCVLNLRDDADFQLGQVLLETRGAELRVDVSAALIGVQRLIDEFFTQHLPSKTEEYSHG